MNSSSNEKNNCTSTEIIFNVRFQTENQSEASMLQIKQKYQSKEEAWSSSDLSELGSGFFLLHSAVSHEVVKHFAWRNRKDN